MHIKAKRPPRSRQSVLLSCKRVTLTADTAAEYDFLATLMVAHVNGGSITVVTAAGDRLTLDLAGLSTDDPGDEIGDDEIDDRESTADVDTKALSRIRRPRRHR